MSTRYCSTCNTHRKTEGGVIKHGRVNRWLCAQCAAAASARQPDVRAEFAPPVIKHDYRTNHRLRG